MVKNLFSKHPWLYLLVTNWFLLVVAGCVFSLFIGVGIGESYHPDSYNRAMFPTVAVVFVISLLAFIGSLLWWIRRHTATGKHCTIFVITTIILTILAGTITFFLTEEQPTYRTYEIRGVSYQIPREYSPKKYWGDNLSIDVCSNSPLVAEYDRSSRQGLGGCEQGTHTIEPTVQGYSQSSGDIFKRELLNNKLGFTIATTTGVLSLNTVDSEVLNETGVHQIITDNQIVFKSTDGGLHKKTFNLEFVDMELRWMTVCSLWYCDIYTPLPDDPKYVLKAAIYNREQYERGFLTDEEVAEFKQISNEVYELLNSFIVEKQKYK